MPSHYWYHCTQCEYRAYRYRNVKRCPYCGGTLDREEETEAQGLPESEQTLMPERAS